MCLRETKEWLSMKPALYCFLLMLLALAAERLYAQPSARDVVKQADEKMRGKTTQGRFTIQIIRPTWKREIQLKSWSLGNDYAMVYVVAPARDQGTVFLKRKKEVWNWLPFIERSIKLPPSMMSQSWMGTDFTNDDLVKEFSILEDYTHQFAGEENIGGRACHIIQLQPNPQAAVVWGKIRLWIDKKDFLMLKGEYYDDAGALVNVMTAGDIRILGGKLLPARMEMSPVDKPGQKTIMIYTDLLFDQPIPETFFTVENMKKVK
jgi:outer membrane lipoprotein-sorting protein